MTAREVEDGYQEETDEQRGGRVDEQELSETQAEKEARFPPQTVAAEKMWSNHDHG